MILLQHKKGLLALAGLILVIGLIIFASTLKRPTKQAPSEVVSATPTPIPLPQTAFQNLGITSTTPSDGDTAVSLLASVSATFSRVLTDAEKQHVSFTVTPTLPGTTTWNNTTITFIPTHGFSLSTSYHVTITYGSLTKSWSFTTAKDAALSQEEKQTLQGQSDAQFGAWQNSVYTGYPWYDNFPLQTADSFTYFDLDTKSFITELYVDPTNTERVNQAKADVLQQVSSFGINTKSFPFVWTFTSE